MKSLLVPLGIVSRLEGPVLGTDRPSAHAPGHRAPAPASRRSLRWASLLLALALALASSASAGTFVDVTSDAGVGYSQHTAMAQPNCRHDFLSFTTGQPITGVFCEPERMTGGAAVADVDGDGWPDLYVTRLDGPDLLFRNLGNGTFQDITTSAGLSTIVKAANGAAFVDVDNDDDPDLVVTTTGRAGADDAGRNLLLINDGFGVFSEEAVARGAAVSQSYARNGTSIGFGDYDLDGFTDLFIGEWRPNTMVLGAATTNALLRNQGSAMPGHFADATLAAGVDPSLPSNDVWVFSPAFVDLDDDRWPELALASDFGASQLYQNDRDGTFSEITGTAGVGTDENGMGSAFGDYDGDGDLDWFVTSIFDPNNSCALGLCDWGTTGNRLYRNEGGGLFSDQTDAAGVRDGRWGWGTVFFDADNDGDLDLVMTNGVRFPGPTVDDELYNNDVLRFWENDGAGNFTEVSALVGLTDTGSGKGLLTFDYDGDGDLDLFVVNNETGGLLYRNDETSGNAWLRVTATGTQSNRDGWGAVIRVQRDSDGPVQTRHLGAASHFLGQSENVAHFGLGAMPGGELIHRVDVYWPASDTTQTCFDVTPNQLVSFVESSGPGGEGSAPCAAAAPVPSLEHLAVWLLAAALLLTAVVAMRRPIRLD